MIEDFNKKRADSQDSAQKRMRDLYDTMPYKNTRLKGLQQGSPLLEHWINSALGNGSKVLFPEAHILVAGCGAGAEVKMLAKHYPKAHVVGLDFSEASIKVAERMAEHEKLANVTFEVVDLTKEDWPQKFDPFDFVLCHGVADYVSNLSSLLNRLQTCLAESGLIYFTVNTPEHPARKIRKAFADLGLPPDSYTDTSDQRALLETVAGLVGNLNGISNLASAPKDYLEIDIFPPIAHHFSLDKWCKYASETGLYFCGSIEALDGLSQLSDSQLPPLYQLGRVAFSKWLINLRSIPAMQLLFSRKRPTDLSFNDVDKLLQWRPTLSAVVGTLPELLGSPSAQMNISMQFENMDALKIYTTAFDLEVLRKCDGVSSVAEIIDSIEAQGNMDVLRASLFRAYHYGILS